jgi:hypothetical protein
MDAIHVWFALRIKKRLVKEVDDRVNIIAACHMTTTWLLCMYVVCHSTCVKNASNDNKDKDRRSRHCFVQSLVKNGLNLSTLSAMIIECSK